MNMVMNFNIPYAYGGFVRWFSVSFSKTVLLLGVQCVIILRLTCVTNTGKQSSSNSLQA